MRNLISRKTIKINELNQIEMLCFNDTKGTFLDIYNIYNKELRIIGRFVLDEFYHPTVYNYNGKYFVLYKQNDKNEVIDIITFYDFENHTNIIDKYQNLINRFNCYGGNLAINNVFANKKYRKSSTTNKKVLSELTEFNSVYDFYKWLYQLVSTGFCNSDSVQEKSNDTSNTKIYSLEICKSMKKDLNL